MKGLNMVQLIGNLTMNIDVRNVRDLFIATGAIAVNERVGDKDETTYFNFEAFGKRAEVMGLYLRKGSRVYLQGSLKSNNYDKKDGSGKVYGYKLLVDDFVMLDKKEQSDKE